MYRSDAVTGGDVANFVAENAGHPRLGVEVGEDPAGHVHVAAGKRERVHDGVVEGSEGEPQLRPMAHPSEPPPYLSDVGGELGIFDLAVLSDDRGIGRRAELDLLRFAHQRELSLAGHRVHGAGRHHDHARHGGGVHEHGVRPRAGHHIHGKLQVKAQR